MPPGFSESLHRLNECLPAASKMTEYVVPDEDLVLFWNGPLDVCESQDLRRTNRSHRYGE